VNHGDICKKRSFRYSCSHSAQISSGGRLGTVEKVGCNPSSPSQENSAGVPTGSSGSAPHQTVARRKGLPNLHARIVPVDFLVTRKPSSSVVFKYIFARAF
jgi:hypothetical protein